MCPGSSKLALCLDAISCSSAHGPKTWFTEHQVDIPTNGGGEYLGNLDRLALICSSDREAWSAYDTG